MAVDHRLTGAGNNRFIHFLDVSTECDSLWPDAVYPDKFVQAPDLAFHGGCPLAEIWITDLKASVSGSGDMAVATAKQYGHMSYNFYHTNGERPFTLDGAGNKNYQRPMWSIHAGTMSIAVNATIGSGSDPMCWYLDSYFCSGLHEFKTLFGSPAEARMVVTLVTWIIVCLAALYLFCIKFHALLACWECSHKNDDKDKDRDGDGVFSMEERFLAFVEEASNWNPLLLALLITLIVAPPLILSEILVPCWECADFEAAILHETGHFFGLGHPDYVPNNLHTDVAKYNPYAKPENVYQEFLAENGRVNASSCTLASLWAGVKAGVPKNWPNSSMETGKNGYPVRNSVMEAFTQHNPKPCLTQDDVEALMVLYPDCVETNRVDVVCPKVNHNIGLVRLSMFVIAPLLIALICIVAFNTIIHAYHKKELDEARKEAKRRKHAQGLQTTEHERDKKKLQVARFKAAKASVIMATRESVSRPPPGMEMGSIQLEGTTSHDMPPMGGGSFVREP